MSKPKTRFHTRLNIMIDDEILRKLQVIGDVAGGQSPSSAMRYAITELYRRQVAEGVIDATDKVAA